MYEFIFKITFKSYIPRNIIEKSKSPIFLASKNELGSSRAIRVRVNFPLCSIQNSNSLMDASVRASQCTLTHTYTCTRAHAHGWLYLRRVRKWRRTRRLKKGAICRPMAGTPCAWECRWGYVYTRHSPFPIHFLPRAGFF